MCDKHTHARVILFYSINQSLVLYPKAVLFKFPGLNVMEAAKNGSRLFRFSQTPEKLPFPQCSQPKYTFFVISHFQVFSFILGACEKNSATFAYFSSVQG